MPNKVFENRVSVDKVKFNFKKSLNRKEVSHIVALQKAQKTIDVAIEQQEVKDQKEEEDNLMSKVKVRPKTPPYKEINRYEKDELEGIDRRQRAIILL